MDLKQLQEFLEVVPDAMIAVSSDQRIVAANQILGSLFGYSVDELLDQPIRTLIPEPLRGLHPTPQANGGNWPQTANQEGRHRDSTVFPIEVGLSRITLDSGGWAVLGCVRDITMRETLRNQIRRAHQMELVGQLASGISHDFNNLLTVILCNCRMLEDVVADSEERDLVEGIQAAATHAVSLTRQILSKSRLPVGRMEVFDLQAVIRRVAPMLDRLLGFDIELQLSLDGEPAVIRADSSQIEQILVNLIINARDALPRGGHVTICVKSPPATSRHLVGPHTRISVVDDGVGMSEEVAERAFEPLFTTKPEGKGTGLGLAMVSELVKASGGSIQLHTFEGDGTRFDIDLPQADDALRYRPDGAEVGLQRAGTEVVVLVEPAPATRQTLRRILAGHGLIVIEAADAATSLQRIKDLAADPRLFIIDLDLPGSSGSELARRLRRNRPETTLLFLSSYGNLDAAPDPDISCIAKPFDPRDLLNTIDQILGASAQ